MGSGSGVGGRSWDDEGPKAHFVAVQSGDYEVTAGRNLIELQKPDVVFLIYLLPDGQEIEIELDANCLAAGRYSFHMAMDDETLTHILESEGAERLVVGGRRSQ